MKLRKERQTINQILTKKELMKNFVELGLKPGMVVEVHSSLSSFGHVIGGAQTVVDALMDVITANGTILMPLQNGANSEPSRWVNPPVDVKLEKEIRENYPAFDKKATDGYKMGAIADNFRRRDGIVVSSHPSRAYCAWGRYAKLLTNRQSFHFALSEESPTARLYELKGYVLLLGVGYDNCTCMHLAEYRTDCRPIIMEGAAVVLEGKRVWKKFLDLDLDDRDFVPVGRLMEDKGLVAIKKIGDCEAKLFRADVAIDEADHYLGKQVPYDLYR